MGTCGVVPIYMLTYHIVPYTMHLFNMYAVESTNESSIRISSVLTFISSEVCYLLTRLILQTGDNQSPPVFPWLNPNQISSAL